MQVLKDEIKEAICEAAKECFLEKNFDQTTMRDISLKAKISTGNIYRYFPNKEKIIEEILCPVIHKWRDKDVDRVEDTKDVCSCLEINLLQEDEIIRRFIEDGICFREELVILFLRSKGSRYEAVKEDTVLEIEKKIHAYLNMEFPDSRYIKEMDLYIKATSAGLVESFCVILEESKDDYVFVKNMSFFVELNIKSSVRTLKNLHDDNLQYYRRITNEEIDHYFNSCNSSRCRCHTKSS